MIYQQQWAFILSLEHLGNFHINGWSMVMRYLLNFAFISYSLIILYNILPETEGRTLEDIENHFTDNSKSLTDHKIKKQADYTW